MTGKDLLKEYVKAGWEIDRITGSHHVMKKGNEVEIIPIHGNRDLPIGLANKLKKRIGI